MYKACTHFKPPKLYGFIANIYINIFHHELRIVNIFISGGPFLSLILYWHILSFLRIYLYENSSAMIEYTYLSSIVYNQCTV